ncbi:MAG: glycosyltransferase family 2 protein [Planctomycetes bacterium]|nr:glycosyltransferase family 2 protein [Planctomycetota bacterium]
MPVLFAVIPVYDEPHTLEPCVERVMAVRLPNGWSLKVIVVDDASGSATADVAQRLSHLHRQVGSQFELFTHATNRGKGAALRTGFARVLELAGEADAVITQDGDLEYDPGDYPALVGALSDEPMSAVFGNRWAQSAPVGAGRTFHAGVNRLLTFLSNQITGLRINDMETGYKLFRIPLLREILPLLTEDRFGIEPQMTAALARARAQIAEVPISYSPRDRTSGKKIGPLDGFRALWVIARERVQRESAARPWQKLMLQIAGFALGLVLIAWCISGATRDTSGWQRLRDAPWTSVAGLLLCSLGSIVVSGLTFWIAARPVRVLRVRDQQWINALASMLNYAPVRIGMFTRAAYAMQVDQFRAVELVAWFASLAFTFVVALVAITAATFAWIQFGAWTFLPVLIAVGVLGGGLTRWCATRAFIQKRAKGLERLITDPIALWGSIILHIVDLFFATGRVLLAIQMLGLPLTLAQTFLVSMASFAASLNPLGRLGFREAAVAFTAAALSMGQISGMETKFQTLAVIESAGEALVAIPIGMLAMYPIWRRFNRSKPGPGTAA